MRWTTLVLAVGLTCSGVAIAQEGGQSPPPYSQELVDAAMAKMQARQAVQAAAPPATQPTTRPAEAASRDELMRLRREAQVLRQENERLQQQIRQQQQQMDQLQRDVAAIRNLAQQFQDVGPAEPQTVFVERGGYLPFWNYGGGWYPYRPGPAGPLAPNAPIIQQPDIPIPPPNNAMNPHLTPRNTMNPALTPRNTMNPARTPRNTMNPALTPRNTMDPRTTPRNTMNPGRTPGNSMQNR